MFHVFHVIKIYSVLLLFFSYDTLNEVYHFSGFQICLLIKTASEGKSSFLAVSFKNISRRDLHASERKYRKIYHVKATYFGNWVNIFGNRQGELWQLILDEHIRSLAIVAISQIYQTISDSRESQLMFFYH